MAPDLTADQVGSALRRLGHFRVMAAQQLALEGPPDLISGATLLSLGLRESALANINNPGDTDHGCFQISELYHLSFLRSEPGCREGTWTAVPGHTADETGFCPRYTPACQYALRMLQENAAYAFSKGIREQDRLWFAIAAYNAGIGGAWAGWRDHQDPDRYTTGKDYGKWVLRHRSIVHQWLKAHPKWTPEGQA
jgi:hypothetical protein